MKVRKWWCELVTPAAQKKFLSSTHPSISFSSPPPLPPPQPDWDKLMEQYEDHDSILIAEVDCTAEGKKICDDNGVKGFPTLKHGDM